MELITVAHPDDPKIDMALTGVLLEAVGTGEALDVARVFRPGATAAFGRQDRMLPGFDRARRAAIAHAHEPLVRLGGGHAAVYNEDAVLVEIVRRKDEAAAGLDDRYRDLADLLQKTLTSCSITTELGELPGEYCPGRFSLHLPNGPKVAGIAQRVTTKASLVTAVLVVRNGHRSREVISDIYRELGLPIDPSVAGAVSDQYPDVSIERILGTVLVHLRDRYEATPTALPVELLERAISLPCKHTIARSCARKPTSRATQTRN